MPGPFPISTCGIVARVFINCDSVELPFPAQTKRTKKTQRARSSSPKQHEEEKTKTTARAMRSRLPEVREAARKRRAVPAPAARRRRRRPQRRHSPSSLRRRRTSRSRRVPPEAARAPQALHQAGPTRAQISLHSEALLVLPVVRRAGLTVDVVQAVVRRGRPAPAEPRPSPRPHSPVLSLCHVLQPSSRVSNCLISCRATPGPYLT